MKSVEIGNRSGFAHKECFKCGSRMDKVAPGQYVCPCGFKWNNVRTTLHTTKVVP